MKHRLREGAPAPDFELPDQHGRLHRLRDYRGNWVLLYFYPKDDTPGCTTEACAFRDALREFQALDALVLGVSRDGPPSHAMFVDKYDLNFPLLADTGTKAATAYGAVWGVGPLKAIRRQSFLIDPEGRIARIYRSVDAPRHAGQVLEDLRALRRADAPPAPG
ncbi:peroxiredoxin [Ectothiorhodospiraceae bacterium 2226]|nr:peroxiredoxin [Ectothiorhodospiraceae bacterium 2226]